MPDSLPVPAIETTVWYPESEARSTHADAVKLPAVFTTGPVAVASLAAVPFRLIALVPIFPVTQVTSCTFGGPDLAELYVTSAAYRLSTSQLKKEPHAGATFVCRPGVAGMPASSFAG